MPIQARFRRVLRDQLGRQCDVESHPDDGRVRVRLAAPTALMIAEHLAGWVPWSR